MIPANALSRQHDHTIGIDEKKDVIGLSDELFIKLLDIELWDTVMYCANTDHKTSYLAHLFPGCLRITLRRQLRDLSSRKNHLTPWNASYDSTEPLEYW